MNGRSPDPHRFFLCAGAVLMGAHNGAVDHGIFIVGIGGQLLSSGLASGGSGLLHRIVCDGRKMGFQPRRDNQGLRHRIFAPIAGNAVTPAIDAPVASLGVAHALTGIFCSDRLLLPACWLVEILPDRRKQPWAMARLRVALKFLPALRSGRCVLGRGFSDDAGTLGDERVWIREPLNKGGLDCI